MLELFKKKLLRLDNKMPYLSPIEISEEFKNIPLEIFGKIQINKPADLPNILKWLPDMPSENIQKAWTGNCNQELLKQSVQFIRTVISNYHSITHKPINKGAILDFGCGWGRLTRLLYKYVPTNQIYAVDPWDESIKICEDCQIHGNLFVSDYIPRSLPTPPGIKFDLIIAFSVFTHLSEKVTQTAIKTLRQNLRDDGVIAITIRPKEYWQVHRFEKDVRRPNKLKKELIIKHEKKGFAFYPHNREKIEGEITYGDTTLSIQYLEKIYGLKIVRLDWNEYDPFQVVVFLRKEQ